ncbi:hypothetical protein J2789_001918 [Variovorax paradoxus]|uniref:hypothetical protein n=1 Tax=Variovorax atrisoli TaxID=3394203 RepID=UPI00119C93C4|nr:hypothetical protein [Variovorax paradoxus]MDR6519236.1 hypothetical protein [Variovorax paradoxus]
MKYLHAIIPLFLSLAPAWTTACSFAGLEREVQFPPTSTHLESEQIISLTNWFIEQKDTSRATHGIYRADIFAFAIKGDADSSRKAHLRLAEIAGLLKTLSDGTSLEVETHVDELDSPPTRRLERLDRLQATVQPACAKTRSCCKWIEGPAASPKQQ